MSRWHQDPPDDDRYEAKPIDAADVPRDGEPWVATVEGRGSMLVMPHSGTEVSLTTLAIDPAEHAAHALIDALTTLEQEIVKTRDLDRAHFLKQLTKRAWQHVTLVDGKASDAIDRLVERCR